MITLKKYIGTAEKAAVPNKVTKIGSEAFRDQKGLKEVFLPDTVLFIEQGAFYGCRDIVVHFRGCEFAADDSHDGNISSLYKYKFLMFFVKPQEESVVPDDGFDCADDSFVCEDDGFEINKYRMLLRYTGSDADVVIPDGITMIMNGAFSGSEMKSITIPESVEYIRSYAFSDCKGLTNVRIPSNVSYIGSFVFSGCSNLRRVFISRFSATVGYGVFDGCAKDLEIVYRYKSVHSNNFSDYNHYNISDFYYEKTASNTLVKYRGGEENVDISDIAEIVTWRTGYYDYVGAFEGDWQLKSVTLGKGLQSIDKRTFKDCVNLTGITVPSACQSICYAAFFNCGSLKSVTLPQGLTHIREYAFYKCEALKFVEIPDSVVHIGYNAFKGCDDITVRYKGRDYTQADLASLYAEMDPVHENELTLIVPLEER